MRGLLVRYGLAMTSVVLVAFLVPIGLLSRSLAQESALSVARQDAQRVAVFAGGVAEDDARLEATLLAVNEGERRTTVFLPDRTAVGAPADWSAATELAARGRALTATTDGGIEVLVPVGGTAGTSVVRTFVPDAELTQGVAQSWLVLAVVGLVLLAGTAFAGDRVAARLARSVRDLSEVARRLGAGDLDARVTPSGPAEVASVGLVLNDLGARVTGLLDDERELVADLSHRLRTPITALRLDVDLLEDPAERARMTGHVEELVEAVDAIIRTARRHEPPPARRCDAARVVRERATFWGVLAADQGRALHVDVPDGVVAVPVSEADLGAALDVLVDNVFRHTAGGTPFALAVRPLGPRVRIVVADDGSGLADEALAERGRSGTGSTGIGLDVARRTAESAGGWLQIGHADARDPQGTAVDPAGPSEGFQGPGARFVLDLPAALTEP